ncbi:MAG: folC [Gammaproteobacteria bacterium]|jgi:dihydrofolate synthase/folylpolyglutamate synthase|nr:folC [Gammaproteobacteria bacterium]
MKSLKEWLETIKSAHPMEVDLSLERTKEVAKRLGIVDSLCPIITVAGTNGKGSCVAGIEAIMLAAGYKVGAFTSPFLFRYNEQVRLQGQSVTDEWLCDAFERVASVCGQITLTLFEFGTLAAMVIFKEANLDIWVLEVGMGGRWDAVNILDADIAVVSSIDIDHAAWLGNTREAIAREKAGIFRPYQPAVYGDFDPPSSLIQYAATLKTPLFFQGQQFGFSKKNETWDWWSLHPTKLDNLPLPALTLQNMSTVLMVIELLQTKLPVLRMEIESGLKKVKLPGRLQIIPGTVTQILDVSHNPSAVKLLANYLKENSCNGKTYAVFSMLADKDIVATLEVIRDLIDVWHVAPLKNERAASQELLASCFRKTNLENVIFHSSIKEAHEIAMQQAEANGRVVVFGSFHTVAEVQ